MSKRRAGTRNGVSSSAPSLEFLEDRRLLSAGGLPASLASLKSLAENANTQAAATHAEGSQATGAKAGAHAALQQHNDQAGPLNLQNLLAIEAALAEDTAASSPSSEGLAHQLNGAIQVLLDGLLSSPSDSSNESGAGSNGIGPQESDVNAAALNTIAKAASAVMSSVGLGATSQKTSAEPAAAQKTTDGKESDNVSGQSLSKGTVKPTETLESQSAAKADETKEVSAEKKEQGPTVTKAGDSIEGPFQLITSDVGSHMALDESMAARSDDVSTDDPTAALAGFLLAGQGREERVVASQEEGSDVGLFSTGVPEEEQVASAVVDPAGKNTRFVMLPEGQRVLDNLFWPLVDAYPTADVHPPVSLDDCLTDSGAEEAVASNADEPQPLADVTAEAGIASDLKLDHLLSQVDELSRRLGESLPAADHARWLAAAAAVAAGVAYAGLRQRRGHVSRRLGLAGAEEEAATWVPGLPEALPTQIA